MLLLLYRRGILKKRCSKEQTRDPQVEKIKINNITAARARMNVKVEKMNVALRSETIIIR